MAIWEAQIETRTPEDVTKQKLLFLGEKIFLQQTGVSIPSL